ncbi:MAG: 3,4-dihydroxyphenylacetate 2,3-dioxygenase [Methanomassiliicoccales archaeon]
MVRAAHVEFLVKNLQRAREFYVDTLGFHVTEEDEEHIYLRGYEDRFHHCLILTSSKEIGVGHFAYRVESAEDLEEFGKMLQEKGIEAAMIEEDTERGQGKALRFIDPSGFPVELFHEMEGAEWLMQRFHLQRGSGVSRLDHFNIMTKEVEKTVNWYSALGFLMSEYVEDEKGGISAAWMRRKQSSHDIAIMNGEGPRFHHAGFYVNDRDAVINCADILSSRGYYRNIERGPGRHGITNAFFLYVRDPEGNRIEFYNGDYLTADPDWKPIVWRNDDPQRQTFWGTPAPESWWKEASRVFPFHRE